MKIKLVRFMQFDGSAMQPRVLAGMGRVGSLAVGDVVKDPVDGIARIASLDYETRSGAIVIRKAKHPDNPTDASRSWNRSTGSSDPKADWCAIAIGNAMIVGDDESQQGQQQKAGK